MTLFRASQIFAALLGLFAASSAHDVAAQVVFESASGNKISMGISMGSENWLFHNFEVTETLKNPRVGMFLETYAFTQVFAAIVALDNEQDVPNSINLSTPDLLGTAIFDVLPTGSAGADRSGIMPLTLQPGWYALGFGTDAFGIPDGPYVGTLLFNTDLAPNSDPYGQFQANHFAHPNTRHFYQGAAARFFVAATPPSPDFNTDGYIGGDDLEIWQSGYGVNDAGDADGDGDTDGRDFLKWQRAYAPKPLLTNGDFEQGEIEPWTPYFTPNGSGSPQVRVFDVDGDGTATNAMRTRSGMFDFPGASPAGVGIQQSFLLDDPGDYAVELDLAASNEDTVGNGAPGIFELFVDGLLVDSLDLTGTTILPGQVIRNSLSGIAHDLASGEHTLQVLFTRPALDSRLIYQYIDDVTIQPFSGLAAVHNVPEPGTWHLAILAGLLLSRRRNSRAARLANIAPEHHEQL